MKLLIKISILLMIILLIYVKLNCQQKNQYDTTRVVTIENITKLKIPQNIFKDFEGRIEPGTEDIIASDGIEHNFPSNFFVTEDNKIIFDIYREEGYSILIFNKNGKLENEIKLHLYSEYFKEKGAVYKTMLFHDSLVITGHFKFYLIDINNEKLLIEKGKGEGGLQIDYVNHGLFFMNSYKDFKTNTKIRIIDIYNNKSYFYPVFESHNYNELLIIDSLVISVTNNAVFEVANLDTNNNLFNYNFTKLTNKEKHEYNRIIGGKNNILYVIHYSYILNQYINNYIDKIYILKYNNFKLESKSLLNYNIKLNKYFESDKWKLDEFPGGLIYHYSKYFDKLYVLYFENDGAYIGEINLEW